MIMNLNVEQSLKKKRNTNERCRNKNGKMDVWCMTRPNRITHEYIRASLGVTRK